MTIQEDSNHGLIERTEFSDNDNVGVFAHYTNPYVHVYVPPENFTFYNNVFRGNERSILIGDSGEPLIRNITIINNRFYDNDGIPIEVNEIDGIKVYNNVFYNNNNADDLRVDGTTYDLIVRNNLLGGSITTTLATDPVVDHNMDHQDSFFVDVSSRDFHLVGGCTAIDAGIDVGLPYTGTAPDIGAYEYTG
jgi:hypothetical protein